MPFRTLICTLLLALTLNTSAMTEKAATKPLQALYITGGCCHDYETQKKILTEGISERANVEWTIVHEGGTTSDHKVSIYADPDWAKKYDVVVHNECFAADFSDEYIHRITDAHKAGVPAVLIHCAMHCYRGKTNAWFDLCGVTSRNHGPHHPIKVENVGRKHPIMKNLAGSWQTPEGELYNIVATGPNFKPLAIGVSKDLSQSNACVWTNTYGKARVFGTTIGHHNVTMRQNGYLEMVTAGLLWACDQLDEDGNPKPGYEPKKTDWSGDQISKFPASEKAVRLFNGQDFTGWEGNTEKYWSIAGDTIVAKNTKENAPKVSTYLHTKKKYRNFRLVFESKLVTSNMHSGIALWGKKYDIDGEPFSYQGHLVMYPSNYGFWDLYRRNSIYQDKDGVARKAGHQHDWNKMEILAIGHRIRHVINGKVVADWSDPKPELCETGPISLQLHSNGVPQEVHFRGLIVSENPEDKLITVEE